MPYQGFPRLTLDSNPDAPVLSSEASPQQAAPAVPALSLADLQAMEVLGSLPVWVLSGLRLKRIGWRHLQSGWVVGVFKMDVPESHLNDIFGEDSSQM